MGELRNCPFCGAGSDFVGAAYSVGCANCGAEGPHGKTEADSIALWNTRPAPSEAEVEAAAKRMAELCSPPKGASFEDACEWVPPTIEDLARAALGVE